MAYIGAALALVTGLTLLNMLLCLGVVRRLREQDERLAQLESGNDHVRPGTLIPAFTILTTDGERLTERWFHDRVSLVAFMSYGCGACKEELTALAKLLAEPDSDKLNVLVAFAWVGGAQREELPARLLERVTLVEDSPNGALMAAFNVNAYPTFYVVEEDGKIAFSTTSVVDLTRGQKPYADSVVK